MAKKREWYKVVALLPDEDSAWDYAKWRSIGAPACVFDVLPSGHLPKVKR